ncbi:TetR/AcrR family transcriptional regulator [Thermodesulfobacteriota bacterium]
MKLNTKKVSVKISNPELIQKRHNQIFEAALKLISSKGYDMTTLRELSEESGIGLGNIYNYIGKKTDILYILWENLNKIITEEFTHLAHKNIDPAVKLKKMIEKELKIISNYEDLVMIIYQEGHSMGKGSLKSMLSGEEEHVSYYKQALDEGVKSGVFRRHNTLAMSHLIKSMMDSWILKRWAMRKKVSMNQIKREILNLIYDGLLNK